jgi:cytochrome P450
MPVLMTRFLLRPTGFLEDCRDRFGEMFTVVLSTGRTIVITSSPQVIKQVFTGDPTQLLAGEANVVLKPILGPRSVLTLDGKEHLRQRRLMLPPFHGDRMRGYGEVMREVAERAVSTWPVGEPFAVARSTQAITLEIIMRAVFGISDQRRLDELGAALRRLLDATASPPRLVALQFTRSDRARPRSPWGRMRAMMAGSDALLLDEIRERRAAGDVEERGDILSMLMAARDEDGQPLSDAELRDELMTLLVAGHETTATALAWTLERVVRHPAVLERLEEEARSATDDATPYLDATIKETLRLRPVVPAVVRRLTVDHEFGDWTLPAGVHIGPSIYLLHRRADLYPEPDAFRPERFLDRPPGTYEWIPFGGSIRRCLGAAFALYEMKMVLGVVLRSVDLRREAGAEDEVVRRRAVTFVPGRGGRVTVGQRIAG